MNVYQNCPTFENEQFILRLTKREDSFDLLKVYSDARAVPFFNGDNCHGDNFYYTTQERMDSAVAFWEEAYQKGWFVRWSIVDKTTNQVIGTIEEFRREAEDFFTDCGLLRLDLRSDYETTEIIESILSLMAKPSFDVFGCKMVATKAVTVATDRRNALMNLGFEECCSPLVGFDGAKYYNYFVLKK